MPLPRVHRKLAGPAIFAVCLIGTAYFVLALLPVSRGAAQPRRFTVQPGEGFRDIASRLVREDFIRSAFSFKVFSLMTGSAIRLKPGVYELNEGMSTPAIVGVLALGTPREREVRIPEGASLYLIDKLLSEQGILAEGTFASFAARAADPVEGKLFPDKYKLFLNSAPDEVAAKFLGNFEAKARPLLERGGGDAARTLILASLLEKEVPDFEDRRIVAGILLKRLKAGMPLQVDATVCYAKEVARGIYGSCYPIDAADLKIDSPYNTYLSRGLPPTPIGNPGVSAIEAALSPKESPYWFYLSDPGTQKTIFSRTLDEHARNRAKYLK